MSAPKQEMTRMLDATAGHGDTEDMARDLLAALPKEDALGPHAKARVWAKIRSPKRRPVPVSLRVLAFAVLLLASAALAEKRMHLLGAFTSSSVGSGTELGGAAALTPSSSTQTPLGVLPSAPAPETELAPTAAPAPPPIAALPEANAPTFQAPSGHAVQSADRIAAVVSSAAVPPRVPVPVPSAAPEPARSMEEAELVLDGLRALRKEGNPSRAEVLFSQYLARHPGGALAEDAMGYRMEAADRMGSPEAARLAASYLKSHPAGRYVGLAQRLSDRPEAK